MQRRLYWQNVCVTRVASAVIFLCLLAIPVEAQPLNFGSADDPYENIIPQWWLRQSNVDLTGGVSLIGAQWRSAANISTTLQSRDVALRIAGTVRAGVFGVKEEDTDELYDLVRLVEYAKYQPARATKLHLRAGTTDRLRLGQGHLVDFYSSRVVWDDRLVGAEAGWRSRSLSLEAFTGDLRLNSVSGGRAELAPFIWSPNERWRSMRIAVSGVDDRLDQPVSGSLRAYSGDVQMAAANIGDILVSPFVSWAQIEDYGSGYALGVDVGADNFVDLARFRLRLAYHRNSDQFVAGYVGSFYEVSNPGAVILKAEDIDGDETERLVANALLEDIDANSEFVTELRLLFFERFEIWSSFKRNFGSDALSEYHLRVFFSSSKLKVQLSQDRGGLRGLFSLFNDLGDQTSLTFRTEYEVTPLVWLFVTTRYSYEERRSLEDGRRAYAVERRFEPMAGFRFWF